LRDIDRYGLLVSYLVALKVDYLGAVFKFVEADCAALLCFNFAAEVSFHVEWDPSSKRRFLLKLFLISLLFLALKAILLNHFVEVREPQRKQ